MMQEQTALSPLLKQTLDAHLAGRIKEATAGYREILGTFPDQPDALTNLGQILLSDPTTQVEALSYLRQAVAICPDHPVCRLNLGAALLHLDQPQAALVELDVALALSPTADLSASLYNNRGTALRRLGRREEALSSFQRALAAKPNHPGAQNNLGLLLFDLGRTSEAARRFQMAIEANPGYAEAKANLAGPLSVMGKVKEARACLTEAIAQQPGLFAAHHGLLMNLHYEYTPQEQLDAARTRYGMLACPALPKAPPVRDPDPERRLRIGYLSADFRTHSVAHFLWPLLFAHDRSKFEIFGYASVEKPDAMTSHLATMCSRFREVHALSDVALGNLIAEDRIDILVDLSGHTTGNRLSVMALRKAPIQVTYLGYPDRTGLPTIDYRFTDAEADPIGVDKGDTSFPEALYRLKDGFLCYGPPPEAPEVTKAPVRDRGYLTFACFNNLPKLSAQACATFARVLRALPNSRLCLKSQGFSEEAIRAEVRSRFAEHGIMAERLSLMHLCPSLASHLGCYAETDIALDTFPYNGTTTTCEALYMGVPVITLVGKAHAGRVGRSILARIGLGDLCAQDEDGFVQLAVELSRDPARLFALRQGLRQRLLSSPLCDGRKMTKAIEDAYRDMWKRRLLSGAGR